MSLSRILYKSIMQEIGVPKKTSADRARRVGLTKTSPGGEKVKKTLNRSVERDIYGLLNETTKNFQIDQDWSNVKFPKSVPKDHTTLQIVKRILKTGKLIPFKGFLSGSTLYVTHFPETGLLYYQQDIRDVEFVDIGEDKYKYKNVSWDTIDNVRFER